MDTRDTVVRVHGMSRCAKYQNRTRTRGTRDPITVGIPVPVTNPTGQWSIEPQKLQKGAMLYSSAQHPAKSLLSFSIPSSIGYPVLLPYQLSLL